MSLRSEVIRIVNELLGNSKKISELPAASALTGTEQVEVNQGGTSARTTSQAIANLGGGGGGAVSSVFTRTGAVTAQPGDYTVAQVTGAAPLASPTFTGTPAAPTAVPGTNTSQLATTAFVATAVGGGTPGGADTQIQYNNAGSFGGSANNTWNNTNKTQTITNAGLGVIQGDAVVLQNPTDAAAAAQQISPAIRFHGEGWKTDATAASQEVDFRIDLLPVQGTTAPSSKLRFMKSINGSAFSSVFSATSGGALEIETQSDPNGGQVDIYLNKATPTVTDRLGEMHFYGNDSLGNKTQYAAIYAESPNVTDGTEGGRLLMNLTTNAAVIEFFKAEPVSTHVDLALANATTVFGSTKKIAAGAQHSSLPSQIFWRYDNTTSGQLLTGVVNTHASGYAEFQVSGDVSMTRANGLGMHKFNSSWSTTGPYKASGGTIEAGTALTGGLNLVSSNSSGIVRFYVGGNNDAAERLSIGSTGTVTAGGSSTTGTSRIFTVAGTEANIDFTITPKGTGVTNMQKVSLTAGTATAGTAPLKIAEGTNLTTPEDGAIEHSSDNLNFTAGSTRYTLAKTLTNTSTLNFDLTAVNYQDLTITVTGAAEGDAVSIGVPNGAVVADVTYFGWVSSANTVTIRCSRVGGGGAADPASGTFRASVIKY